jgi:uncharacterized protein with FMN-binding domain
MTPGTRIVTWLLSTVTVLVLLLGYHTSTAGALRAGSSVLAAPQQAAGGAGTGGGSPGTGSAGGASGVVTGPVVQTQWGPIQVELTVKRGKIVDVGVPVYPSGNSRDTEINNYALPVLVQETLGTQSAQIDMVSGATVTSVGYQQSLQAAIDQAGL